MTDKQTGTIKIGLMSEPFMDDPDGAEAYYTALGRVLVLWGRFESHFGHLLLALSNLKPCAPFRPEAIPISMTDRMRLMRRLLENVPELEPFRKPILGLLPQARDSAEDRHIVVHGHWNGFVKGETLTSRFTRSRHKGGKLFTETYDVSLGMLEIMSNTFDSLNTALIPISWDVCLLSDSLGSQGFSEPK